MNKKILITVGTILIILVGFLLFHIQRSGYIFSPKKEGIFLSVLLNQAKSLEASGDFSAAKEKYEKLLSDFTNSATAPRWQKKVEDLNIKLLFSSIITPKSELYEIKPGDTIDKIAREFKTTPELIMKNNNLSESKIIPGRKIKVWNSPFGILISKSQNTLTLKAGEEVIKVYNVSTGKNNSTPTGTFKIVNKLLNPAWFKTGTVIPFGSPDNILGTRWLGLDLAGYGIHGTTDPQDIGKQATEGCVRLANPDVEELYTIVPIGTEVTIVD